MKNIAVILARGGSKGIPDKNIVMLCGKPLIYYTINAAKYSLVNDVWVSTNCKKIAKTAERFGAKILIRPDELATDTSTSESALIHFCENVKSENVIFIQPTSPLLKSDDINNGIMLMSKFDSVFSGYLEHWIPRWNNIENKLTEDCWDKNYRPRRQDVSEKIVENGAFYISKSSSILNNKLRYSGNIGYVKMPYHRSFQVDNYEDLFVIESIMKNKGD